MASISVLLIDDDDDFRTVLGKELDAMGFRTHPAATREELLRVLTSEPVDVVILDIIMPDLNGIALLQELHQAYPEVEVIMLTAHGTIDSAIQSLKLGAYDYLTKPCSLDEMEAVIRKAYEKKQLRSQNNLLKEQLYRERDGRTLIAASPAMAAVMNHVHKVAATNSTVLLLGESGTGKEVIARAIYRNSQRSANPFVVVDCSTLHENLLESELFGHEKGAYTGAVSLKHGLLEIADGGTLFLDEIGEMDVAVQAKLLRVLETGMFRRLGSTRDITVDVRFIAATNKELETMVQDGHFRDDLFYRLNVFTITIPPLRERVEDIPVLVDQFIRSSRITGKTVRHISDSAMQILRHYAWPGNVRELEHSIERALILCESEAITPQDLPPGMLNRPLRSAAPEDNESQTLESVELRHIQQVLESTGHNKIQAAKILGIDPKTLYRKLKTNSG